MTEYDKDDDPLFCCLEWFSGECDHDHDNRSKP